MAEAAIQGVALLIKAGIDAQGVARFLQRHQRFSELGFNEEEAEAVAEALPEPVPWAGSGRVY